MAQVVKDPDSFDASALPAIKLLFGIETTKKKRVYDSFYRQYSQFVLHELSKRNTFTANLEDLTAQIWVDFSGSAAGIGLIEKFLTQVANSTPSLPETLSGLEVARLLSVNWESWKGAWKRRNVLNVPRPVPIPKFPNPISGLYTDPESVYRTADVEDWFANFERIRHLVVPPTCNEWMLCFPTPLPTKRYFFNYLKTSIANRWANFCRYESRRHRERVWDTFFDQRSPMEEAPPWEDRQETASYQEEDAEVALLVAKLRKSLAPAQIEPVLMGVFDDNLSLRDAIERAEGLTAEQKRVALRDVGDHRTQTAA